jgi:hypothetical protein
LAEKAEEKKVRRTSISLWMILMRNMKDWGERVKFVEEPKKQYWGGYAALFADPDENLFYLVQVKD